MSTAGEGIDVALVRHGLPLRVEGVTRPDPQLSESGLAQARAVAEVMKLLPVSVIASSDLTRAQQTAAPTADKLGITVDIHDDLAEFDNGADYYVPIEDMIAEADPRLEVWRNSLADPEMARIYAEFRRVAAAAVARVARATPSGVAAIFCHGGVIAACVAKALGDVQAPLVEPRYGSVTRITIAPDGQWKLRTYNEIHHIERQIEGAS
ncbi:histidine phosphatase family protein [Mycolicibacter sinensis]|jgi:probable phosphoglycerate mutase|uniref:Phosphoglycerate mutase n=1 Tax=Mycolicibacter sinensis (strain JDM601) TaxID=875328 RepID=A0A1A2EE99_MYCSD|nr:histidine phosphatase family protein [Mycolicibacter sinensis]OBG03111.1 hypothetical protein A5771_14375 [Mycolicibacter sinensis]OBG04327.1 hypothetical protein A5772_05460 [Mycolicibacter sinensis]